MATTKIPSAHAAGQVAALLALPEIVRLIADLGETRWTGRPGYPICTMVGAALVKAVYALPTWTRTARLIAEHGALREAIGGTPSHWACYRFAAKLREHNDMLTSCIEQVLATLHEANPQVGKVIAIDGSDLPAYANGHKHVGNKNGHCAPGSRTRTPGGGTGRPSPPGRAARITATKFMPRSAPPPICRWPGSWRRRTRPSRSRCPACWIPRCGAASPPARACSTRATTGSRCTTRASPGASGR
jgi:hypothetical protein